MSTPTKRKTRYIVGVFKNGRGAGLLTVFARSKKEAEQCAKNVIGYRKLDIGSIESFRKWATPRVRQVAIDTFISQNWNRAMRA